MPEENQILSPKTREISNALESMEQPITITQAVLQRVSSDYNVAVDVIIGRCRDSELVDLRCIIASVLTNLGFFRSEIGRFLNRDHTTVINLNNRTQKRLDLQNIVERYVEIFKPR